MASLSRFCLAVFLISSHIISHANSISASGGALAVTSIRGAISSVPTGATYSTSSAGLRTAFRQTFQSAANNAKYTLAGESVTSASGVRAALRATLKNPMNRASFYTFMIAWGLDKALEVNGFYDEDKTWYVVDLEVIPARTYYHFFGRLNSFNPPVDIDLYSSNVSATCARLNVPFVQGDEGWGICRTSSVGEGINYMREGECNSGYVYYDNACHAEHEIPRREMTQDEIADAIPWESYEIPKGVPSETVSPIIPHIPASETSVSYQPLTKEYPVVTHTDADGKVTETKKTETVSVVNPNTAPALNTKTQETTNTYEDGVQTSSETSTTEVNSTNASDSQQEQDNQEQDKEEQITDCDFMPTVCKFIEWFQSDIESAPDFESVLKPQDVDITKEYSFGHDSASCPSPKPIHLSFFNSTVYIDYSQFCYWASIMKIFIVSCALLLSAKILSGSLSNG